MYSKGAINCPCVTNPQFAVNIQCILFIRTPRVLKSHKHFSLLKSQCLIKKIFHVLALALSWLKKTQQQQQQNSPGSINPSCVKHSTCEYIPSIIMRVIHPLNAIRLRHLASLIAVCLPFSATTCHCHCRKGIIQLYYCCGKIRLVSVRTWVS